jgi:hypothetical protein
MYKCDLIEVIVKVIPMCKHHVMRMCEKVKELAGDNWSSSCLHHFIHEERVSDVLAFIFSLPH